MQTIGRWRVFAAISLFIFVLIGQPPASRGQQPDAQLVANAILQPVAPDNVPETGTFYPLSGFISNNGSLSAPYPFDPATNGVVYSLNTNANTFLVVDVPLTNDDELINALSLLAQQQGARATDFADLNPGDAGTNSGGDGADLPMFDGSYAFDTNQLWLQIIGVTNGVASLVIHPPAGQSNGVYDLYYTTNLDSPIAWQWLLRTEAGQTNLTVPNATNAQGFYDIQPPNDLAGGDSPGTNFWMMFLSLYNEGGANTLSLIISSPLGATGTVSAAGLYVNGPTVVVTNCGDAGLNGTYVLTNLTAQEQEEWSSESITPNDTGYVNGTNWVDYVGDDSLIFSYNSNADTINPLYYKSGTDLNGSTNDWQNGNDPDTPPATICQQVPFSQSFSLAAETATNIGIPLAAMTADYDVVETNGINITASQPVAVYALEYFSEVSAAFTAYPTPLVGSNYCILAYPGLDSSSPSEFSIVATEDDTTVWITPSATADLIDGYTNTYTKTLNQGDTYQTASNNGGDDVTGTWIASDKPVAVFAGANITEVPVGIGYANPLVQEQLPVEQWGMQALSMGFAGRTNGDSYRVLAANDDTTLTITGAVVTVVSAGPPATVAITNETLTTNVLAGVPFDIIVDGPVEFQGNQPIQVAHFANGSSFDNATGDPCEILLPPTGHYLQTNIFVTFTNALSVQDIGDFTENYLSIIVPHSAVTNVFVDGSMVAATNFVTIGSSGYYGAQIVMTNGGAHIVASPWPVGVEVYGWGPDDAYGYFGGIVK